MVEVARAAGCSQSTVSVVLNHTPGFKISEETRSRVAQAVIALGYVPRSSLAMRRHAGARGRGGADQAEGAIPGLSRVEPRGHSFVEQVSRALAMRILSGHYRAGSSLPGDVELLATFGVSRTVLREALKTLTSKGLIKAKARVGTRVRPRSDWHLFDPDVLMWQAEAGLSRAFVGSLAEIRMMLEPEAAALAAIRRTQSDLDHLYRFARRMGASRDARDEFAKADLGFHLAVAAAADNPFLKAVSALIEVSLTAALSRSWPGNEPGGVERSSRDHIAIVKAIENQDPDAARLAMRTVITEGTLRATAVEA